MKKLIALKSGFIRYKRLEFNWSIYSCALPICIEINSKIFSIQFLFITLFYIKN